MLSCNALACDSDSECLEGLALTGLILVEQFPKGFEKASLPSGKGYIRTTEQPNLP